MAAREEILAAVRRGIAPRKVEAPGIPLPSPVPPPAAVEQQIQAFTAGATAAAATVVRVRTVADVPAAVHDFLVTQELPARIIVGGTAARIPFGNESRLQISNARMADDGDTLVTGCVAAIAEFGAVALASGPGHAAESAFLAATLIVVVQAGQLVESLEDVWCRLRESAVGGVAPRMVNIILGPSRTADLGVPSRLGAHGPRRVHIVLVDTAE